MTYLLDTNILIYLSKNRPPGIGRRIDELPDADELCMSFVTCHGHHHPGHGHAHGAGAHTPDAGLEERRIKARSEQEIEELRTGRGMAMALAAELNGYPGPLHTLELARELGLTLEQEQQTRQLFAEMQQEAGSRTAR